MGRPACADCAGQLKRLFAPQSQADIHRQLHENAVPALRSVCATIVEQEWAQSEVETHDDLARLTIKLNDGAAMTYEVAAKTRALAAYTAREAVERRRSVTWTLVARTSGVPGQRDLSGLSSDQIARDILGQIERWRGRP